MMQLRSATPTDSPQLLDIANMTLLKPITLTDFISGLEHNVQCGQMAILLAELDGQIAGCGVLSQGSFLPANGFYIGMRDHRPDWRLR